MITLYPGPPPEETPVDEDLLNELEDRYYEAWRDAQWED